LFDTVHMVAKQVYISPEVLSQYDPKVVTFYEKEHGALYSRYEIYGERLPYIVYRESNKSLTIKKSEVYVSFYLLVNGFGKITNRYWLNHLPSKELTLHI
jgi:hypothetical protein